MVRVTAIASETLVGELNGSLTSRVKDIADTLDNAGIPSRASDNIMRDIWHKALYNIALNPLSAIFGVSYGEIADNPHTRRLIKQMISEAFQVARASGIDPVLRIQYQPMEKDLEECKRLGKDIAIKVKNVAEKHTKPESDSKREDASLQEVKMGEGGH